jgi:hypothetical protein
VGHDLRPAIGRTIRFNDIHREAEMVNREASRAVHDTLSDAGNQGALLATLPSGE